MDEKNYIPIDLSTNILFIKHCGMTIILYLLIFKNDTYCSGGICERQDVEQVTCQTESHSNSNLIACSFWFWILVSSDYIFLQINKSKKSAAI